MKKDSSMTLKKKSFLGKIILLICLIIIAVSTDELSYIFSSYNSGKIIRDFIEEWRE